MDLADRFIQRETAQRFPAGCLVSLEFGALVCQLGGSLKGLEGLRQHPRAKGGGGLVVDQFATAEKIEFAFGQGLTRGITERKTGNAIHGDVGVAVARAMRRRIGADRNITPRTTGVDRIDAQEIGAVKGECFGGRTKVGVVANAEIAARPQAVERSRHAPEPRHAGNRRQRWNSVGSNHQQGRLDATLVLDFEPVKPEQERGQLDPVCRPALVVGIPAAFERHPPGHGPADVDGGRRIGAHEDFAGNTATAVLIFDIGQNLCSDAIIVGAVAHGRKQGAFGFDGRAARCAIKRFVSLDDTHAAGEPV